MTEQTPEYVDIEIELEKYQFDFIEQNGIDLNVLARKILDELMKRDNKLNILNLKKSELLDSILENKIKLGKIEDEIRVLEGEQS